MSGFARVAGMALSALAAAATRSGEPAKPRDRRPLGELKDFDAVSLGGSDTLLVSSGSAFSIQVEGDPRAIERLDIFVEDHVLHVTRLPRYGGAWRFDDDDGATVRVTMPQLRSVTLYGSGDLRADRMAGDRVEAALAGSGDISIADIDAREARFDLAGSGTLMARGSVEESRVSIAGSGDIRADQVMARHARVSIAGSGDAYAHASEGAKVSIVGSGDATIRGTSNCELSRIGSGDLHCAT
jgi:hypothetical protein